MHELGVLYQAVKMVERIAKQNQISHVRHVTLEVGEDSGYVPYFLHKLFPLAIDSFPILENARLQIEMAPGRGLQIRDIGY